MNIGRMIFYDKVTGEKIVDTGEWSGVIIKKTVEQQIATYTELSERNRDTFDVLELPYGAYAQDFAECNGYRVNLETRTLEFSYPDPNDPGVEQPYQAPLSEKVATLETQVQTQEQAIADLTIYMATLGV